MNVNVKTLLSRLGLCLPAYCSINYIGSFFFYLNNFFGLQSAKQGTWNSIGGCRFSCPLEGWTNPFDVSPFLAKRASTGRTWPSPERRKRRWLCRRWCNYLFRWIEWSIYLLRSSNKNNTKISYNTSQYIYLEKWHFFVSDYTKLIKIPLYIDIA